MSADDVLTVTTIQGVTARECPIVYKNSSSNGGSYSVWLSALQAHYGVFVTPVSSVAHLLAALPGRFSGYVLVNASDVSTAIGYTVAAATNVVAVTSTNEATAIAAGLKLILDARSMSQTAALDMYNNTNGFVFNPRIAALQDPTKTGYLGDYTTFAGGVFWWDTDMNSGLSTRVLGALQGPAAVFGWGVAEDGTVKAASVNGAYVHASDWAKNLAVLSNYRSASTPRAAPETRRQAERVQAPLAPVHTVSFLFTDGDNVQFMLDSFTSAAAWWGSTDRGSTPIGWTLTPALEVLAAPVADVIHSTAVPGMDYFVCAPSGIGYTYPDMLSQTALADFVDLTAAFMAASGQRLVNVLAEDYSVQAAAAFNANPNIDGVLWYDYYSYSGLNGNITFLNGKPVIGGRFQLWTGVFDDPSQLLSHLLQMPADPTSSDGYSLIPVHIWTNNVTEVKWVTQQLLAHGGFDVVTPDVFVARVAANIPH